MTQSLKGYGCDCRFVTNTDEGGTYVNEETLFGFEAFTSIVIPSTVVEINPSVFNDRRALEYIKVSPDNPVYDSREDCNAIIKTETDVMLVASLNTEVPSGVDIDPEGVEDYFGDRLK